MGLCKLQEIVKDREAWLATVNGVTKSWTRLSDWTTATCQWKRYHLPMKNSEWYLSSLPLTPLGVASPRSPSVLLRVYCFIWIHLQPLKQIRDTHSQWSISKKPKPSPWVWIFNNVGGGMWREGSPCHFSAPYPLLSFSWLSYSLCLHVVGSC